MNVFFEFFFPHCINLIKLIFFNQKLSYKVYANLPPFNKRKSPLRLLCKISFQLKRLKTIKAKSQKPFKIHTTMWTKKIINLITNFPLQQNKWQSHFQLIEKRIIKMLIWIFQSTGACGIILGHPFDTIKAWQQRTNKPIGTTMYNIIITNNGLNGFYKGFYFPLITNGKISWLGLPRIDFHTFQAQSMLLCSGHMEISCECFRKGIRYIQRN